MFKRGGGSMVRRAQAMPNLGRMPFTDTQKLSLDLRARNVQLAPSYVHPDLSFFNPPADSQPFFVSPDPAPGYPDVGAGQTEVIRYVVANGLTAIINKLSIIHIGGAPPDFTGRVIWRVLQNGAGIRGLNNLTAEYGTFAQPKSLVIRAVENDVVQVTVECPALLPDGSVNPGMPGGTKTAASFDGFTYPLAETQSA